ncbi:L,D-transpeptidase family protein [Kordiimonas pumila]|uniref:L,D-transpeptidase n=1 Tax=Kordiimonas pumila TaxID=2161677 RepID=A0ABV7D9E7_9PROT|nr:L,D-transpeptidase family protein [Kordiimonas pumila]
MIEWIVTPDTANPKKGVVTGPVFKAPCALGRSGVRLVGEKREGDGYTPAGRYPLRYVYYRPDRIAAPMTGLPVYPLSVDMGWCDDPESPDYNRPVRLPFVPSHEQLWRDDEIYDLILVIGHNDSPVIAHMGSAVFVHIARENFSPTAGCVALQQESLLRLLRQSGPGDQIVITYP